MIARGFAELLRFAEAYGGEAETLMGLSGLGDLVLTCSSAQSRNFAFGERLGRGIAVGDAAGGKLAEGALTASVLVALARAKGIDMPIAEAVEAVIADRLTLDQAVDALMQRPLRREVLSSTFTTSHDQSAPHRHRTPYRRCPRGAPAETPV